MAATGKLTGGCFCGALRYAVAGNDYRTANCHCTMCRRTSGAPVVSWFVVPVAEFKFTKGKPRHLKSSEDGNRYFCKLCGTPLTCTLNSNPDWLDVTTCSLDTPEKMVPKIDVHTDTRLSWVDLVEQNQIAH